MQPASMCLEKRAALSGCRSGGALFDYGQTRSNKEVKMPFTEAVSFVVRCDTQQDVDYYWDKLTAGGQESQ